MNDKAFKDYVVNDLLGKISGITARAMFGGFGIYKDGFFFAVIVDGQLYFKVDDTNISDYKAAGSKPWTYGSGNKKVTMGYWLLPEEILENPYEVGEWVEKAVKVAKAKKKGKKK